MARVVIYSFLSVTHLVAIAYCEGCHSVFIHKLYALFIGLHITLELIRFL